MYLLKKFHGLEKNNYFNLTNIDKIWNKKCKDPLNNEDNFHSCNLIAVSLNILIIEIWKCWIETDKDKDATKRKGKDDESGEGPSAKKPALKKEVSKPKGRGRGGKQGVAKPAGRGAKKGAKAEPEEAPALGRGRGRGQKRKAEEPAPVGRGRGGKRKKWE